MVKKLDWEISLEFAYFDIHIVSIVSSVSARKSKCPSSARNFHSSGSLEPENSSLNSSLLLRVHTSQCLKREYHWEFVVWQQLLILHPKNQMLVFGTHVRNIALSHVRCACGSACGRLSLKVCAKCVFVDIFQGAMCDQTLIHTFSDENFQNI